MSKDPERRLHLRVVSLMQKLASLERLTKGENIDPFSGHCR